MAEDLRFALGKDINVIVAPAEQVEKRIKQHYGSDTSSMEDVLKQLGEAGEMLQIRETTPTPQSKRTRTPRRSSVLSI